MCNDLTLWQSRSREQSIAVQAPFFSMTVSPGTTPKAVADAKYASVLSAVDAHTAHAIMENCFNGPITNGRTILLVSHHTALVAPSAWHIVALENVSTPAICWSKRTS